MGLQGSTQAGWFSVLDPRSGGRLEKCIDSLGRVRMVANGSPLWMGPVQGRMGQEKSGLGSTPGAYPCLKCKTGGDITLL